MKKDGKGTLRNFNPNEAFFIIDSDNLQNVASALYGFCITDDLITDKLEALGDTEPKGGAYILIKRNENTITIKQDWTGAYGIYLYREGDYFALGNSFTYLVDHVKTRHKITFNREYADHLLISDLAADTYSETMINEIKLLDRSAVIELDVSEKAISWCCVDFKENTVDLDSAEGMRILDGWYKKWTSIIKSLFENGEDITCDLSGGFDSRITFSLILGSGVDINKINVKSLCGYLDLFVEDYEIASQIADHFGFALNNTENLSDEADNFSMEDILDLCWYRRACIHKDGTTVCQRFKKSRYSFGGYGGESIRGRAWFRNKKDFCEGRIASGLRFHFKDIAQLRESVENITKRILDEVSGKFKGFGREIDPILWSIVALYRETRLRSHFNTTIVGWYYHNNFCLSPLMDMDLQKLKLYISKDKRDANALYAIILDRYCSKLLDFKFKGGHGLGDTTIQNAKAVNRAFPYIEQPNEIHVKTDIRDVHMNKIERVPDDAPNKLMTDAFYSSEIKKIFLEKYNEEIYNYISEDSKIRSRSFRPLRTIFPLLAICKIMEDVSSPDTSPCSPADFIISNAARHTENEAGVENNSFLYSYRLIDFHNIGRIDIKNAGSDDNYVELIEISDINASINAPKGLNKNGRSYVIQSRAGSISFKFRCVQSGMLEIKLRSMDIQYEDNDRILIQIDFQKLVINGEVVFDTIHSVNHDEPFQYTKRVSDGDIIAVETEWIPHDMREEQNFIPRMVKMNWRY